MHNHLSRRGLLFGGLAAVQLCLTRAGHAQRAADIFRPLRAVPQVGPDATRWGYDGSVPGPMLRFTRGEEARIRILNSLPEPTALHWHGLRIPNAMDGVPNLTQPAVGPGETFDCRFSPPDAGTFWYRPPLVHAHQIDRGLLGVVIVDELAPPKVDRDVALIFSDSGPAAAQRADALDRSPWHVNGQQSLDIPVRTHERLRLRLLNGSRKRPLQLRFDRHAVRVMAIDGQPAEPFLARGAAVRLGPGNRMDVFLDATLASGAKSAVMLSEPGSETEIARLAYSDQPPTRPEPLPDPPPLPDNPLPGRIELRGALRFDIAVDGEASAGAPAPAAGRAKAKQTKQTAVLGLRSLDGSSQDPGQPLFRVKSGRTVMLSYANRSKEAYVIHLHGHSMRLLDRLDDGWKPFWLDTVMIGPDETIRTAFVADNPGRWMIDGTLMADASARGGWFEVG